MKTRNPLGWSRTGGWAAAGLALSLAGCGYAKEEALKAVQDDLAQLKASYDKQSQLVTELKKSSGEHDGKIQKLNDLVDQANNGVRTSANLGLEVEKLKTDLASTNGRVDDVTNQTNALRKEFTDYRGTSDTKLEQLTNATTTAKAPPVPETADGVFTEAKKRYDGKQWNDARRLFDAFIARYASDSRASTAQFLIGESYLAESKFANAIGAFSKVIDNFPKSEAVPDAMYKNGTAFYALKYCGDAKIYFQELLRRYPKTEWKVDANEQLKKLTKDLKNKAVCQQG